MFLIRRIFPPEKFFPEFALLIDAGMWNSAKSAKFLWWF